MSERSSGPQTGALIGAIGGLIFILVNAGGTGAAAPVRVAGIVLFLAALWWGVFHAPQSDTQVPSPEAWRTYGVSVAAMAAAIPLGTILLTRAFDRTDLTVLWVVAVVGAHFLPFSRAFDAPVFVWLGAAMVAIAALGAVVTLASGSNTAPAWFAVIAGVALLGFVVVGARMAPAPTSARP